jgi:hypothetical protein
LYCLIRFAAGRRRCPRRPNFGMLSASHRPSRRRRRCPSEAEHARRHFCGLALDDGPARANELHSRKTPVESRLQNHLALQTLKANGKLCGGKSGVRTAASRDGESGHRAMQLLSPPLMQRLPSRRAILERVISQHANIRAVCAHHDGLAIRLRIARMDHRFVLEPFADGGERNPLTVG